MGWTPVPACCWLLITMAAGWWSTHRPRWPRWSCGCMPLRSVVIPGDRSGGWGAVGGGRGPGVAGEARAQAGGSDRRCGGGAAGGCDVRGVRAAGGGGDHGRFPEGVRLVLESRGSRVGWPAAGRADPDRDRAVGEKIRAGRVERRNGRDGRSAVESYVGAMRCLYRRAVANGYLTEADNPASKVAKPRRLASTRRALPDDRLAEFTAVAASTPPPIPAGCTVPEQRSLHPAGYGTATWWKHLALTMGCGRTTGTSGM